MGKLPEEIRARIQALRQMTRSRGCTEAEEIGALKKAAELMERYSVEVGDLDFDTADSKLNNGMGSPRGVLWMTIGHCLNCAVFYTYDDKAFGRIVRFYGRAPGPEIATHFHIMLDRAIDRDLKTFKATKPYKRLRSLASRRKASAIFVKGMSDVLAHRLLGFFEGSIDLERFEEASVFQVKTDGEGVPVKRRDPKITHQRAYEEGTRSGREVPINNAVNGRDTQDALNTPALGIEDQC